MIIRRHHTANYTVIGNALVNDERMEADEIGVMAYLLSRPDDWEVRRIQIMKRFRFGRQTMRRVMVNLIRYGWIRATTTRSKESGTVHIRYDVYDDPGEELSEAEAKAALSLVSSEVAETEAQAIEDSSTGGASPGGGSPGAASRGRQGTPGHIESLPSTESPSPEHTKGAREFSEVLEKWPSDKVLSPSAAERMFLRLADRHKAACIDGIVPYLDDCKLHKRMVCGLKTYLDDRRWEALSVPQKAGKPALWITKPGTPQWFRWYKYRKAMGHPLGFMDSQARLNQPVSTPSEWPPAIRPSTGPPETLLTREDEAELRREFTG